MQRWLAAIPVLFLVAASTLASAADSSRRDIEAVFDRNKGRLYAQYAQASRQQPGLKGRVVLQFDIARSGDVTDCRIQSSTLNAPALEGKLCDQVRGWKFPAREAPFTVTKPVDFFPAG